MRHFSGGWSSQIKDWTRRFAFDIEAEPTAKHANSCSVGFREIRNETITWWDKGPCLIKDWGDRGLASPPRLLLARHIVQPLEIDFQGTPTIKGAEETSAFGLDFISRIMGDLQQMTVEALDPCQSLPTNPGE